MPSLDDYGLSPRDVAVLARPKTKVVYVIGDTDTGKTTLAGLLARASAARRRTAMVDLDAGQASIGLPTTLAWAMSGRRGPGRARRLYFTGSTSPVGHIEEWVDGAAMLVAEARERAERIVVDACGLARGSLGQALHHGTIEVIRPDVIVAIERRGELDDLLEPFLESRRPRVVRAQAPAAARRRSRSVRASYRCAKFREYFQSAGTRALNLAAVRILRPKPDPVGRIASLRDRRGRDMALAIVREFNAAAGTVVVLTPLPEGVAVRAIVLGVMRIARDGRQLAREV